MIYSARQYISARGSVLLRPLQGSYRSSASYRENPEFKSEEVTHKSEEKKALPTGPEPHYHKGTGTHRFVYDSHPITLGRRTTRRRKSLRQLDITYETWGSLNANKDNAILLYCGLSASSHAKAHPADLKPGWWEEFIGSGRPLDTDKYFVICPNNLGGCYGTTGPASLDPDTGRPFGLAFPRFTVQDMVFSSFLLLDEFGIKKLHAAVGSSLGGMQSLAAAYMFPHRVSRLVSISAATRSHPLNIAVRFAQRRALMADPLFNNGDYYDKPFPYNGMKLAREIATIFYRSGPEWECRFGRHRLPSNTKNLLHQGMNDNINTFEPDFLIESYLQHQGKKFANHYDPNSLLYLSKAMDEFDIEEEVETPEYTRRSPYHDESIMRRGVLCPTLIIGVRSDMLFPVWQQKEMADYIKKGDNECVSYYEVDAIYGHDTFLLDLASIGCAVKGHIEQHKVWCKQI